MEQMPPLEEIVEMFCGPECGEISSYICPKCGKKNAISLSYNQRCLCYECKFCGDKLGHINGAFHKVIEEQYGIKVQKPIEHFAAGLEELHKEYGGETQIHEKIGNILVQTQNIESGK